MDVLHQTRAALDTVMRRERGRLLAGLVSRFGAVAIDLAEDAVQDAFVEALEEWSYKGLPERPGAMLALVAQRRMIDRLRRYGRETTYFDGSDDRQAPANDQVLSADIVDPELRLIVLCCNPELSESERLTLALKLAGGFTAKEIASLFLAKEAAIGQRVARGLRKLRDRAQSATSQPDTVFQLQVRLPDILNTIYLLFCIGYFPRSGNRLLLKEACDEALRLIELLLARKATCTTEGVALAALLCIQTARFPARADDQGNIVSLKEQDRSLWDKALIARGCAYLEEARLTDEPGPYHLEAAIAGAHVLAPNWEATDWSQIDRLYGALEAMCRSPAVAVNASVARAFAGHPEEALSRLDVLHSDSRVAARYPVQLARAEVLEVLGRSAEAQAALSSALVDDYSEPSRQFIEARRDAMITSSTC